MSRSKKLAKNTFLSMILQLVTIISSFILPKLILAHYGSEVNGLIGSISQFLQIIAFLELGIGSVIQSALYKPLSTRNNVEISKIIASADKFFIRLGLILVGYVLILVIIFPLISNQNFTWQYIAILIFAMSLSSFAQYFFGIVDQLLLTADQRGYIYYTSAILTIIANTIMVVIMIMMGNSIQFVKITTSIIYLARPLLLKLYIRRHYSIDRKIKYSGEPIKQKWNGISQHVASVVLDHTDTIVLTIFSSMTIVSIYTVYHMVVYGVKTLFTSLTNGIQALLGDLYARSETDKLKEAFDWAEWFIHTGVVLLFGCTAVLIVPFVKVYTLGLKDTEVYSQPVFAAIIVLAHATHCLRLPYHIMIKAGGHYKETQFSYLIAAAINVIVSIIMVNIFGLIGVAIGTLVAMIYQTIWMALYNSKHLIERPFFLFVKQLAVDFISVLLSIVCTRWIEIKALNYVSWILIALENFVVFLSIIIIINCIFYREKVTISIKKIAKK